MNKKNVNFAWYLRPDSGIFIIHVTSKYPACATAEAAKQTDNTQILGCMFFVLFFYVHSSKVGAKYEFMTPSLPRPSEQTASLVQSSSFSVNIADSEGSLGFQIQRG